MFVKERVRPQEAWTWLCVRCYACLFISVECDWWCNKIDKDQSCLHVAHAFHGSLSRDAMLSSDVSRRLVDTHPVHLMLFHSPPTYLSQTGCSEGNSTRNETLVSSCQSVFEASFSERMMKNACRCFFFSKMGNFSIPHGFIIDVT